MKTFKIKYRTLNKHLITILLIVIGGSLFGQFSDKEQRQIDSLNAIVNNETSHDTSIASAYVALSNIIYVLNLDTIFPLCMDAQALCEKGLSERPSPEIQISLSASLAEALNNIGYLYKSNGDINKATEYYKRALSIEQRLGNMKGIATTSYNLGFIYVSLDSSDKAVAYFEICISLYNDLGEMGYVALNLNNIGYVYQSKGDLIRALKYYSESLTIREDLFKLNNQKEDAQIIKWLAESHNNLGGIYQVQGNVPLALSHLSKSLTLSEQIPDKNYIAVLSNNIAFIHQKQGNFDHALKFFEKALGIGLELSSSSNPNMSRNGKNSIALSKINMGTLFEEKGQESRAMELYKESLIIYEEIGHKRGIASAWNNIGFIYSKGDSINEALDCFKNTLRLYKELEDKEGLSSVLNNIGSIQLQKGDLLEARSSFERGLQLARGVGAAENISSLAMNLSKVARTQKSYKEALELYELHIQMRDSINNEETQKATIRQQTTYEFEKVQLVKEQEENEATRLLQEETSRRNNLQYSLIFLGILVFFGGVLSLGFIKVSPTIAEGIIFFAFLILFEFLLVLSDPFVDGLTNGEPMYKLLANALLAGLIFPAHAFFERVLKKRLVKSKNEIHEDQ